MNMCDVCRNGFTPNLQGSHWECKCPDCGTDCISYRPNSNQLVYRIEHSNLDPQLGCAPIYEITRDVLTNTSRETLTSYRIFLESFNRTGSIPRISPSMGKSK